MEDLQHKVWYACYGSKLLQERFLCYIMGEQPAGAKMGLDDIRTLY